MTSKVWFALQRKSPFPHLAPSMYGQTPVSRDTACEYMSSWSWPLVPSCQQQWYPQLPMGNYTLDPQGYQFLCAISAPVPWMCPLKQLLGRLCLPYQLPLSGPPRPGLLTETKYPAQKGWVLEALDLQGLKEWPRVKVETGQGAVAQMGAPVHTQQPGSGQNCSEQAHTIMLTDQTCPLRSCYRCIPPPHV